MALSVIDPIGRALTRTREILFAPFDFTKWLKLGFCAFLAHLADNSSGGGGSGSPGSWQEPARSQQIEEAKAWFRDNWELIVSLGAVIILAVLAITTAVLWLQGRGRFMFLDGVVRNRGAVVEPWKTYRAEGNSAFLFKLCLTLMGFVAALMAVGTGLFIAWADIDSGQLGSAAWGGIIIGGALLFLLGVIFGLTDMFLKDLVVPAMYARGIGVMEAWEAVRLEVLSVHTGPIVLYVLMKFVIALVVAAIVMGVVCATLCIAACFLAIPYVGTVLLLPVLVFGRCYSLYFIEQLGGAWVLMPAPGGPGEAPDYSDG